MNTATSTSAPALAALALALLVPAAHAARANPKIADYAVSPITQSSYPKLFAAWGPDGVKRINELLPLAAEKAAASRECDRVEIVEVSDSRSTPRTNVVFFVDCANGKRFYIDEKDLKKAGPVQSQTGKMAGLSDPQAILTCEKAIKAQLTNPLTFSRNFGTTSVYRAPTTGNVVVDFIFEAKNDLGAQLPSKARCVITDRGIEEARISKG